MVYVGSKARIFPQIKDIVLQNIDHVKWYIEPFAGGMNSITQVPNTVQRIACDVDPFVIALWRGLQRGWNIPEKMCSKTEYEQAREIDKHYIRREFDTLGVLTEYDLFLVGVWKYVGSFSGKGFGGMARVSGKRDYYNEHRNNILRHVDDAIDLASINFVCSDYAKLHVDDLRNSIVYADPPYVAATGYRGLTFDSELFWEWARWVRSLDNTYLYVSEWNAPSDFTPAWSNVRTVGLQVQKSMRSNVFESLYV